MCQEPQSTATAAGTPARRATWALTSAGTPVGSLSGRAAVHLCYLHCCKMLTLRQCCDPDPAFQVNLDTDTNPYLGLEFVLLFFNQKLQKKGCHKGRPSLRWNLQPSKENIQHFKRWSLSSVFHFSGPFLPLKDSDCESGYGSRDPIESGSNPDTDQDPQHCFDPRLTSLLTLILFLQ